MPTTMNSSEAVSSRPSVDEEPENIAFPVFDGHVDIIYGMMQAGSSGSFGDLPAGPVTPETLKKGNVRAMVVALYCEDRFNGPRTAAPHLKSLLAFAGDRLASLTAVTGEQDLIDCFQGGGKTGVLFLVENGDALIDLPLEEITRRSIFTVGLTHAGRNRIGDGNSVSSPGGLTGEGKKLLRELDRAGFVVDIAHLSEPCCRELLSVFHGMIISSHTGFRFFCDTPRNLSYDQIKSITERNGLVGVTVNPEMLSMSGSAAIEDVFKHIDWVAQEYGPQYAALGSDFCGFDPINRGMEDASGFPDLAEMFLKHGYPVNIVSDIMGGNWFRFYYSLLKNHA